jgi:hypothetical protein
MAKSHRPYIGRLGRALRLINPTRTTDSFVAIARDAAIYMKVPAAGVCRSTSR